MSNKKIADLVELVSASTGDFLPVVQISNNQTKKVSLNTLRNFMSGTSVGEVKQSALTPEQFTAENWGTWKLLNGQSCVGSKLAILTGWTTVPDAFTDGAFIRQAKTGRVIGSYEAQDFLSHTHTQDAHNHTQNAHNHTQNLHTHTQDSHNHTQLSHNHTQNSHNHSMTSNANNGGAGTASPYSSVGAPSYTNTDDIQSVTAINQAFTALNNPATAMNQSSLATNNAAAAVNIVATAVNQSAGGDETRPNNIAMNFYIRVD